MPVKSTKPIKPELNTTNGLIRLITSNDVTGLSDYYQRNHAHFAP